MAIGLIVGWLWSTQFSSQTYAGVMPVNTGWADKNYVVTEPLDSDELPWFIQNINWGLIGIAPQSFYRAVNPGVYKDGYNLDKGSVGKNNQGLAIYFSRQLANGKCLGNLTKEFYKSLKESSGSPGEATLAEEAGTGAEAGLEKGWLWKKAMTVAGGDANVASFLIGVCGHDNISQGVDAKNEYSLNIFNEKNLEEKKRKLPGNIKFLEDMMANKAAELKKTASDDPKAAEIMKKLDSLRVEITKAKTALADDQRGRLETLTCPSKTAAFYVPGSLGTDIDPALKERVAKIQANGDMGALPAKSYHVYGANFLSCLLKKDGTDPAKIPAIQDMLALGYRSRRFCERINELTDSFGPDWSEFRNWNQLYSSSSGSLIAMDMPDDPLRHKSLDQFLKEQVDKKATDFQLKKFGGKDGLRRQYEAALAFRYLTIGPRDGISDISHLQGLDCLNLSFYPERTKEIEQPAYREYFCGQLKISSADCGPVMNIVNTWNADMEWTRALHKAGAEFAAKNCTTTSKSMDELACEALVKTGKSSLSVGEGSGSGACTEANGCK